MAAVENEHPLDSTALQRILDALSSLQYGVVEITVHEGRVVQIERREKFRIETPRRDRA